MLKNPDASVGDWSKYPVPKIGSTVTRTLGKPAPVTPSRTYPRTPNESGVSPIFRRTVPGDHTYTDVEVGAYPSALDRKSTRLNSSHDQISYAVFCLKKKKN